MQTSPREPRITVYVDSAQRQLPYLDTFCCAAELSSFTKAAKALHVTQAAVSQRVHVLEATLGKALFQRRGGSVQVTEEGRKLYDYAQQILNLHLEARREIGGQVSSVAGNLALAASSIPGEHLLPGLLSIFHEKHPQIHVAANVSDSATVMEQVERGEVSLGLLGRKADRPHLNFRYLASDCMVLVVPPNHALSRRRQIALKDLCRHPIVLRENGSGLRHCFEKALERVGLALTDLQVSLELGSNEAIKRSIRRGTGIAILSGYAVQNELKTGLLRAVKIHDLNCDREMFVVHDRRRVLPPPARTFLNFLDTTPLTSLIS